MNDATTISSAIDSAESYEVAAKMFAMRARSHIEERFAAVREGCQKYAADNAGLARELRDIDARYSR